MLVPKGLTTIGMVTGGVPVGPIALLLKLRGAGEKAGLSRVPTIEIERDILGWTVTV